MDLPDSKILIDIVNWKMPYGKFKGRLICDLPVEYLIWLKQKEALPDGRLGVLLSEVYEMKYNDLYDLLRELKVRYNRG